jgi:AcrR family transcriptional regulator
MPPAVSAGDRIVAAACDVVRERGLRRLTISSVAARAGISSALVHYHFDTKQRLIVAAARSIATGRSSARARALAGGPGLATLDELWSVLVAEAADGRARAYLELAALGRAEAAIAETLADQHEVERRLLTERLPDLLAELGSRPATGSDELALALEALLDGAGLALLGGRPARVVRAAYDSFWLVLIAAGQSAPAR